MKNIIALILAAAQCLMGLSALAEANGDDMLFKDLGVTLHFPEAFRNIQGTVAADMAAEVPDDNGDPTGVYGIVVAYAGLSRAELDALHDADEVSQEQMDRVENNTVPLMLLVGAREGADMTAAGVDPANLEQVGQSGDITWYIFNMGEMSNFEDAACAEEYERLAAMIPEVLSMAEFYAPVDPIAEMRGKHIEFTTTDFDGSPVDSAELFGSHEYTAVNIWASWCTYCVEEMPELKELNDRLADMDCAVVGVLSDSAKPRKLEKAMGIAQEKGADYAMLQAPENLDGLFYIPGFPTTYIVDREGNVVGDPIIGPDVEDIEARLVDLLGN